MPVKGDEVADRIEGRIREAVDRMMGEIDTSIQDVRKAIEQQLDAAVQSVQADVKGFTFRGHLEEGIRELEEALTSGVPQAPQRPDSTALRAAVRAIESGRNQVEVLTALLEQCLQYGSRSALMILKQETFTGWKAAGFSAHGGNDEQMKRFAANRDGAPQFDSLLREEHSIEWDGRNLAERFGVTPSSRALLIPMVIKDKVAAAVYVDATTEDADRFDRPSLELLVFITGLLIDTLAIRKKLPSPSLSADEQQPSGQQESAPASQPAPEDSRPANAEEFSPEQTVAIRYPNFTPGAPPDNVPSSLPSEEDEGRTEPEGQPEREQPSETPSRTFQIDTSASAQERFETPATSGEDASYSTAMFRTIEPESIPEPSQPEESSPADEPLASEPSGESAAERPSTQYVPPPGIERGAAFGARNSDERRHEEAKRFARLLVSEIKLYNESKVEQGRRERDIYERLKEDIDRSRQMYDDRVPEDVRNGTNYFYEELVRILADGDRETLGL
ncbi:MAG TPA: hypothetical protein VMS12_06825 [Thermoanaerobaculia bacterium]|nr:hypothetical protein [Thermoanaerobaculia bacterium]